MNKSVKIIGSPDGQVFIEACVWISVLGIIWTGYAVAFRKEYVGYEKMIREKSGYHPNILKD